MRPALCSKCFVHQHKQQSGTAAKFRPCAKRGILVGHDRHSLSWYAWLMQESTLVKSSHITLESEVKILDIMMELKAVGLSDGEGEPSGVEKAAPIDRDDGPGR